MKMQSRICAVSCLIGLVSACTALAGDPVTVSGNLNATLHGQPSFELQGSRNLNGDIRIISRQAAEVRVTYHKKARASSDAEARKFLDLIDFKLTVEDEDALLRILTPSHAPWQGTNYSVQVEVLIELPEKSSIEIRSQFMNVEIGGPFRSVDVESGFSAVEIKKIFGPVDVRTDNGSIVLAAIKGQLKARTENGGIEARDIVVPSGSAVLQTSNGPISLAEIQGPVEAYTSNAGIEARGIVATDGSVVLRTSYASITAEAVKGELICETSYGNVDVRDVSINHGHSRLETSYAPIVAHLADISNCELYVTDDYSNIDLSVPENVSALLVASVDRGGKIHTKNLSIIPKAIDLTRLEGFVGDGESRIEVNVDGIGSINIDGR